MNLVSINQFFNLAKVLTCDGTTTSLNCYHSQVSSDYDNISLVVTVKSNEHLIKRIENKILVNLGCDYEITINRGKEYTNFQVTTK